LEATAEPKASGDASMRMVDLLCQS
jgi:hypothetical protein